jgi:YHS domain-containing protein
MVSPTKASYSSDSEDNIPLSQMKTPVSRRTVRRAEFDAMEEEEQEAAEKEGFYNNSDDDEAEDSDLGYKPRSTVRSRNRAYVPSSDDDDDDSSDGGKKPAAKPAKKSKPNNKKQKGVRKEKCQGKSCPGLPPTELRPMIKCSIESCPKLVHQICYDKMIEKSTKLRSKIDGKIFCNLGHHDEFVKSTSEPELTWTNDGKEGPKDPHHSEYYLVEWLSSEVNYQRFRDPPGSLTKMKVCEELASYLKRKGIRSDWTGENVYNKIQHVEQKMKACHDGYVGTKTGAGLKETDPMGYEEKVSCLRCIVIKFTLSHDFLSD